MATFTWTPDYPFTETSKPRVRKAEFGDGYEQRIRFGLNTDLKTYPLTFKARDNTETAAIRAFLEARGGSESFTWTPPLWGAAAGQYVCEEWQITGDSCELSSISATFREVAEPA
jgi:phage-related protein